jgi:Outer membrane protein beta-barrel domain
MIANRARSTPVRHNLLLTACAVLAGLMLAGMSAADELPQGWYAGIGAGSTHAEEPAGWAWISGPTESGVVLNGGYRFTRHFALELGMVRSSGIAWNDPEYYLPDFYVSALSFDVEALEASIVYLWPFADVFEGYVKGGIAHAATESRQTTSAYDGSAIKTEVLDYAGTDILFGFGISARINLRWRVRLEYQFFYIRDEALAVYNTPTVDTWLLGLDYLMQPTGKPRSR